MIQPTVCIPHNNNRNYHTNNQITTKLSLIITLNGYKNNNTITYIHNKANNSNDDLLWLDIYNVLSNYQQQHYNKYWNWTLYNDTIVKYISHSYTEDPIDLHESINFFRNNLIINTTNTIQYRVKSFIIQIKHPINNINNKTSIKLGFIEYKSDLIYNYDHLYVISRQIIDEILCLKTMNTDVIIMLQDKNTALSYSSSQLLYLMRQKLKQYVDIFLTTTSMNINTNNNLVINNNAIYNDNSNNKTNKVIDTITTITDTRQTKDIKQVYLMNTLIINTLLIYNIELTQSKLIINSQVIDSYKLNYK